MEDPRIWNGVDALLDEYARIRSDDFVLLLYAPDSCESAGWVCAVLEMRGIRYRRVWMAPLRDERFKVRLAAEVPRREEVSGRLVVLTFERDTMSHSHVLREALADYGPEEHLVIRLISAGDALFKVALSVTPRQLSAVNTSLLTRFIDAEQLRIKTGSGSDLQITLDNKRHRWISNRGTARTGAVIVLPAGEVATYPAVVAGRLVADFAFNVNAITDRDARLQQHPVTVIVENSEAVDVHCDDTQAYSFLLECFRGQCASHVGELGFGTNSGIVEPIALNSHINERRPGVHLGFGQHNQAPGVVDYQCPIHLDLIAAGGLVWVDDDPTPLDLDRIAPSLQPHPAGPRDEDVFAPEDLEIDDCCGIITCDGLTLFQPGLE